MRLFSLVLLCAAVTQSFVLQIPTSTTTTTTTTLFAKRDHKYRLYNVPVPVGTANIADGSGSDKALVTIAKDRIRGSVSSVKVVRRSLDARKKNNIHWKYVSEQAVRTKRGDKR